MYTALDSLIDDSSSYKHIAERHRKDIDALELAFDIVKNFIIDKRRIIYGGMSIDLTLKAAKQPGIYADDAIPDYDFMSPDAYDDSIELARLVAVGLAEHGVQVSAINALHPTTRRVRVGFTPVADVTYCPPSIFDTLPTVEYLGFRIIHPTFQRLDMHRAFTVPMEQPPREVAFHRMRKDIKRFNLLNQAYPVSMDVAQSVSTNTLEMKISELESLIDGGVIGGFLAYAVALIEASELDSDVPDTIPISIDMNDDILKLTYPATLQDYMSVNIMSEKFLEVRDKLLPGETEPIYRNRYLEDLKPRSIELTSRGIAWDIHDSHGRLVPYGTYKNIKFASIHHVCLWFLTNHFIYAGGPVWMELYCSALRILEKLDIKSYKVELYGFDNWSYAYVINAQRQLAQISGMDPKLLPVARPPHGYYIDDPKNPPDPQKFDPKTSWVFAIDGSIVTEPFEPLSIQPPANTKTGAGTETDEIRNAFESKTFDPIWSVKAIPGSMPYKEPEYIPTNCHAGQRKLLLTEIEFYTKYSDDVDLIIYAGSADGDHTDIILKMFPGKKLLLIDPAFHSIDANWVMVYQNLAVVNKRNLRLFQSNIKSKNPIVAAHNKRLLHAWFYKSPNLKDVDLLQTASDYLAGVKTETIKAVMEHHRAIEFGSVVKDILSDTAHRVFIIQDYLTPSLIDKIKLSLDTARSDILFVSDLRSTMCSEAPSDADYLWNDALNIYATKTWRPLASMLKFHPPYFDRATFQKFLKSPVPIHVSMQRDIKLILEWTDMFENYRLGKHMMFDADEIWLQAWAPAFSSETRMIVSRSAIDKPFINYDHDEWDNKFQYLNKMRSYAYFDAFYSVLPASTKYDGCFDCMLEILILGQYLLKLRKQQNREPENVHDFIAHDPTPLLKLSNLIDAAFPYPMFGNNKCGFHGQITKPLEGLNLFKIKHGGLYKISCTTGNEIEVVTEDPKSFAMADNVTSVSDSVLATVRKYY